LLYTGGILCLFVLCSVVVWLNFDQSGSPASRIGFAALLGFLFTSSLSLAAWS